MATVPRGGDDHGGYHHCAAHGDLLRTDGASNPQSPLQNLPIRSAVLFSVETQFRRTNKAGPHHHNGYNRRCETRAERRAKYAVTGNQQRVESHIQRAGDRVKDAGGNHVPAALKACGCKPAQLHEGQRAGIDEEIMRCIPVQIFFAAQPHGQGAADCNPGKHEKHGKDHRRNDAVFEHIACLFVIPGPHMVRNLNGKAGRYCGTKAA